MKRNAALFVLPGFAGIVMSLWINNPAMAISFWTISAQDPINQTTLTGTFNIDPHATTPINNLNLEVQANGRISETFIFTTDNLMSRRLVRSNVTGPFFYLATSRATMGLTFDQQLSEQIDRTEVLFAFTSLQLPIRITEFQAVGEGVAERIPAVPTPALLPGLIGLGIRVWQTRRKQ